MILIIIKREKREKSNPHLTAENESIIELEGDARDK